MLELDNLDLDLDDDFPTGPLNKINTLENSFSNSLLWNEKRNEKNPVCNTNKLRTYSEGSGKGGFPLNKSCDIVEKNDKNEEILMKEIITANLKSACFSSDSSNCKDISKFDDNELNSTKDSINKRILSLRKFPGPAGLLPDKPLKDLSDVNIIVDDSAENVNPEIEKESVILCSQPPSIFSEASYKKLASDFDLNEENCQLNKFNIAWVKKKALQKSFKGIKIPFLAVVVHHVDLSTPDPVLKLMDQTGEMYGILHREVWSNLGGKLHPGAAFALRQVGVLITWIAKRQIYLNITVNNILNIYSYSGENVLETGTINELIKSDLMKDIAMWKFETSVLKMNSCPQPFSAVGKNKVYSSVSYAKESELNSKSNNIFETKNTAFPNRHCTGNILPGNSINNALHTDDDIIDFMGSLDEDFIFEEFLDEAENHNFNGVGKNEQYQGICRKRKLEMDVTNSSQETEDKLAENNSSLPPTKLGKVKCQEKFISVKQPLNQIQNEIAEEPLSGIDFADFSVFDDFEI